MKSRSASPAGPFCGQSLSWHCALEGSDVAASPSKFIARSTEFTAFGAVVLECALELFFHGAHSMHMPQNSFASGHAITIVSQGEWISDVLDLSPCTHLKSPVACANIWNKESLFWTLYKESNHHYRAIRSWGALVGVLRPLFCSWPLPLACCPGLLGREPTPQPRVCDQKGHPCDRSLGRYCWLRSIGARCGSSMVNFSMAFEPLASRAGVRDPLRCPVNGWSCLSCLSPLSHRGF
jgi:hypothetical protein